MNYSQGQGTNYLGHMMRTLKPAARAVVTGSAAYPALEGYVTFYPSGNGVLVAAEFRGLPSESGPCAGGIFGFHIHEGGSCTGNAQDPFADVGGHYNPNNCPHPEHAGDLPPLFGNDGFAWQTVYTSRFTVPAIIGRAVVVHAMPDNFTSQPAGDSGERIGCGTIMAVN